MGVEKLGDPLRLFSGAAPPFEDGVSNGVSLGFGRRGVPFLRDWFFSLHPRPPLSVLQPFLFLSVLAQIFLERALLDRSFAFDDRSPSRPLFRPHLLAGGAVVASSWVAVPFPRFVVRDFAFGAFGLRAMFPVQLFHEVGAGVMPAWEVVLSAHVASLKFFFGFWAV